jgi:hypothetical protein
MARDRGVADGLPERPVGIRGRTRAKNGNSFPVRRSSGLLEGSGHVRSAGTASTGPSSPPVGPVSGSRTSRKGRVAGGATGGSPQGVSAPEPPGIARDAPSCPQGRVAREGRAREGSRKRGSREARVGDGSEGRTRIGCLGRWGAEAARGGRAPRRWNVRIGPDQGPGSRAEQVHRRQARVQGCQEAVGQAGAPAGSATQR